MTREQYEQLQGIIQRAKKTAADSGLRIVVVDHLYPENDDERFNYAPIQGVAILYRPEHVALIGVAYPNGSFGTAFDILEESQR